MNHEYRKKPIVVEAFQMTKERRETNEDWPDWLHRAWNKDASALGALHMLQLAGHPDRRLVIHTLEGQMVVQWGAFIIKGIHNELYPCEPDIFAATYDKVAP